MLLQLKEREMATATVSASVDVATKRIASAYIRQSGMTLNEVIRNFIETIAATGSIPECGLSAKAAAKTDDNFLALMELRARVPRGTPLATMTSADLREELSGRDV